MGSLRLGSGEGEESETMTGGLWMFLGRMLRRGCDAFRFLARIGLLLEGEEEGEGEATSFTSSPFSEEEDSSSSSEEPSSIQSTVLLLALLEGAFLLRELLLLLLLVLLPPLGSSVGLRNDVCFLDRVLRGGDARYRLFHLIVRVNEHPICLCNQSHTVNR